MKIFGFSILIFIISLNCFSQNPIVDSIPMRDGKMLAADIYLPDTTKSFPVILIQTPYNRLLYRFGLPLVGKDISNSQYAFVIVDWRCFYGSKDACKINPDRGKDGYDVIDWIVKQKWSNGKVGTWGPSALGKIQYQTAREQHPNHVCAVPIVAAPQFEYEEYYPGGVYRTEYVEQLDALGYGLSPFLKAHPYYDATWQYVEAANMYPEKIKIPLLMIGGWFDHNIDLMFDFFDTLIKVSDPNVRDQHKFLVGPWSHNSVGKKQVGELECPDAEGLSDQYALEFFDYYLLGAKNGWPLKQQYLLSKLRIGYDEIKVDGFFQSSYKDILYFISNDENYQYLSQQPKVGTDSFLIEYDPKNPSPTIGGMTLRTNLAQGPCKIDSLLSRKDVLVFTFNVGEYSQISLYGESKLILFASSDRPDTDFGVRLAFFNGFSDDHSKDGEFIISDGIKRTRFINGYSASDTQFMRKGEISKIEIDLPPFNAEIMHSVSIIISCSNYPRYDLNLNNGHEPFVGGDTLIAHNYIYTGEKYPSRWIFNGHSNIYGIEEKPEPNFQIYPNPANNKIVISNRKNFNEAFDIQIFDMSGKLVYAQQHFLDKNHEIDISSLPPNVYLIKISNKKHSEIQKFVKL